MDTSPEKTNSNRSRKLSRRQFTLTAGAGTLAAVAGCLGSNGDDEETTVRVASRLTPESVDPINDGTILRRIGLIESLVTVDFESELAPSLATEWTVDDDDRTWVFELRDDVQFHDGTELSASAAVTSLERSFDEAALEDIPVESVGTRDEYALEITTERPFAPLPAHLARHETALLSPDSYDEDSSIETPYATGPFSLDSWQAEEHVTVRRNDDYHGTVPTIDAAVYESVPDNQTRTLSLENGDVEMAQVLPTSAVDTLEAAEGIEVEVYDIPRMRCAQFNTRFAPFDDQRVRQAASKAIDRELIAEELLDGLIDPAVGPYPPFVEWANDDLEPHRYDPDRAAELLEEAGWTGEDVRIKDSEELSVTIVTYPDRPALPDIAEVLQEQLGAVGFDADVEIWEVSAIHDQAAEGAEIVIWSANVHGWPADPDRLSYMFHSEEGGLHHGYDNPEVDELLEAGQEAVDDFDRRKEIYDEVQQITMEEVPVTYFTYYEMIVGRLEELRGYEHHPTEYSFHLEDVTLE